ncbi:MAG: hypothetical protein ACK5XA_10020 [Tagaea sp.]
MAGTRDDKIELSAEELERLSSDSEGGPARRATGWLGWVTGIGAFALAAYALYWTQFSINTTIYRASFLALSLALTFLLYPLVRDLRATRNATIEEWCVAAIGAAGMYFLYSEGRIVERSPFACYVLVALALCCKQNN